MVARGKGVEPKEPRKKQASIGIPPGLADEVERFIKRHPEFGIQFRNEFFHFAGQHFLQVLNSRVLQSLIIEAAKNGRHEHVEALLKAVRLVDESNR